MQQCGKKEIRVSSLKLLCCVFGRSEIYRLISLHFHEDRGFQLFSVLAPLSSLSLSSQSYAFKGD